MVSLSHRIIFLQCKNRLIHLYLCCIWQYFTAEILDLSHGGEMASHNLDRKREFVEERNEPLVSALMEPEVQGLSPCNLYSIFMPVTFLWGYRKPHAANGLKVNEIK